ncbi:MAG TPA: UDP-N-acetylmuramoyl-L-alanine--D-glutamate ligase, partial [Cellulomonas sp.]|nr:UDP-N-acetylmuramoyl-L-alanine--D-glutamate ligase [Cellulomonas sp.]
MAGQDLDGARVVVAGLGVSGRAAADVLASVGARVVPVDDAAGDAVSSAEYLAGSGLDRADLVVASPGLAPHHPLIAAALVRGLPVWSEV